MDEEIEGKYGDISGRGNGGVISGKENKMWGEKQIYTNLYFLFFKLTHHGW